FGRQPIDMLRIPRVLSVYAASTAERRWHLANYREQPDGDQSKLHDQPLGMASICPTSAEFQSALPAGSVYLHTRYQCPRGAAEFPCAIFDPCADSEKPSRFGLGSRPASRSRLTSAAGDAHLNVTPYGQMNFGR